MKLWRQSGLVLFIWHDDLLSYLPEVLLQVDWEILLTGNRGPSRFGTELLPVTLRGNSTLVYLVNVGLACRPASISSAFQQRSWDVLVHAQGLALAAPGPCPGFGSCWSVSETSALNLSTLRWGPRNTGPQRPAWQRWERREGWPYWTQWRERGARFVFDLIGQKC